MLQCSYWRNLGPNLFIVVTVLALGTGCSTSFHYTPNHAQAYPSAASASGGLAIQTGQDTRPGDEIRPDWARNAESIVAHALAAEIKNADLFRPVKLHADSADSRKYSTTLQFRIAKFECYSDAMFYEKTGREVLHFLGIRGALIAESIPIKYVSEVAVEFEVLETATQRSVFRKSYSARREDRFNGYQGEKPKVQQTSAALEAVLTEFLADLAKLPLSRRN